MEANCYHSKKWSTQIFANGDLVYAEYFTLAPEKLVLGNIEKVTSPVSYQIRLENGQTF